MPRRLESRESRVNNNQHMRALFDLCGQVYNLGQESFDGICLVAFSALQHLRAVVRDNSDGSSSADENIPKEEQTFDIRGHGKTEEIQSRMKFSYKFRVLSQVVVLEMVITILCELEEFSRHT